MAVVSDLLGEGLAEEKQEVSGEAWRSDSASERYRRYLGDGAAEALAEVTPHPAWTSARPLMVPAADMTADIMALMEDRSPLVEDRSPLVEDRSPLVEDGSPLVRLSSRPPVSSGAPFMAAEGGAETREETGR